MNTHNNLQYVSSFNKQQQINYDPQYNNRYTINLLINKKSHLQQINEHIMQTTSDIKQQNRISRVKNHHSSHNYRNDQLFDKYSEKYSLRRSSPKNQSYKFNYGSYQVNAPTTTAYFKSPTTTTTPYYPITTSSDIKTFSSSKVKFFYDNPDQINSNDKENDNDFRRQYDSPKKLNPIIYHQPYKSTDFILFPNSNPSIAPSSIERKSSLNKNIKFHYINQQQQNNSSQSINQNTKSSLTYLHNRNPVSYNQYPSSQQIERKPSLKSLKRTRSQEDLMIKSQTIYQPIKSRFKKGNKRYDEIFYDMDEGSKKQENKSISNKQKTQNHSLPKVIKVKTTQISQQKKPNILAQYFFQLKAKQNLLMAVVLITLAMVIFLIQLVS